MDGNTRTLAEIDPKNVLTGESPHAIDEWPEVPGGWDAVRFAVDMEKKRGKFILTGSVAKPEGVRHSGIGRIARVRMRTMSLFESGDSNGKVSLGAIMAGEKFSADISDMNIQNLVYAACRGGWPACFDDEEAKNPLMISQNYLGRRDHAIVGFC